jgi:uncharacterized protein (TIGR03437 family)
MRRLLGRFGLVLGLPCLICAQAPVIYTHGVTNAASYTASDLPTGAIALGSIFTIFGTNLGPATGVQVSAFPLGTTFHGVSITVTQCGTMVNAYPLYVGASSVNAIMPSNTPLGLVSVRLTYNGLQSNPIPVRVVNDSAGIFTFTGTGMGPAAAFDRSQYGPG